VGLIYIFKNIWLFGYPFFPVQIGDFGVSWLPNSEILKQSSEVAITKTYDLQYSIQKFKNLQLGIIFSIGLLCILTKNTSILHLFCL
jgi:hypothetical protein